MGLFDGINYSYSGGGGLLGSLLYPTQKTENIFATQRAQSLQEQNEEFERREQAQREADASRQGRMWSRAGQPMQQQFGAAATPFNFNGPGSMTSIDPAQLTGFPAPIQPTPFAPQMPAPVQFAPATVAQAPTTPQPQAVPAQVNDIAVGGYQMPRFGTVADFTPQQPTDASARSRLPAAAAPAAAMPDNSPGRFEAGLRGFTDNIQAGPIGALLGGLGGAITGRVAPSAQDVQRATYQAAIANGLDPNKALLVATNPKAFEAYSQQLFGPKNTPKSFEEAAVQEALANKGGSGSTALADAQKRFEANKIESEAAKKKATTIAEKQGELAVSLPDALARVEQSIKQIDELAAHPGKYWNTGAASIIPAIPGQAGADFNARVKQLKGGAFLEAYKQLRGTGSISEKEGAKAEAAIARLDQSTSEKDFDRSLSDIRQVLVEGYKRAQEMAGNQSPQSYQMPVGHSRTIGGVTIKRVN